MKHLWSEEELVAEWSISFDEHAIIEPFNKVNQLGFIINSSITISLAYSQIKQLQHQNQLLATSVINWMPVSPFFINMISWEEPPEGTEKRY